MSCDDGEEVDDDDDGMLLLLLLFVVGVFCSFVFGVDGGVVSVGDDVGEGVLFGEVVDIALAIVATVVVELAVNFVVLLVADFGQVNVA
jgi:hypothetical protein